MVRAVTRAQGFGAAMATPVAALDSACDGIPNRLPPDDGGTVSVRAVVLDSGARSCRPGAPVAARICAGSGVILAGGGSPARQPGVSS